MPWVGPTRARQAAAAGGGGRRATSRAGLRWLGRGGLSRQVQAAGLLQDGALQALMVALMVAPMVVAALEAEEERTVEVRGERAAAAEAAERAAVALGSVGVGSTVAGKD
jgi:hypothetical protein